MSRVLSKPLTFNHSYATYCSGTESYCREILGNRTITVHFEVDET